VALALTSHRRALAAGASLLAAVAFAVAAAGRGCVGAPGPDAAVRAFVDASRAGDRQAVFDLLGPQTQQRLEERARSATDLVGSSVRYTPLDLISIAASDDEPARIELHTVEERGDHAVVEVVSGAGRDRIGLVRVDGRWRVELPAYGSEL